MSMLPPEMEASSGPPRCTRDPLRLPGLPTAMDPGTLKPAALARRWDNAPSDGPNMLHLENFEDVVRDIIGHHYAV